MQDAFVAEKSTVGAWADIGYVAPGTFTKGTPTKYKLDEEGNEVVDEEGNPVVETQGRVSSSATNNFWFIESSVPDGSLKLTNGWGAANRVKLNDCSAGTNQVPVWTISTEAKGDGSGELTYTAAVSEDCLVLTPSFNAIVRN